MRHDEATGVALQNAGAKLVLSGALVDSDAGIGWSWEQPFALASLATGVLSNSLVVKAEALVSAHSSLSFVSFSVTMLILFSTFFFRHFQAPNAMYTFTLRATNVAGVEGRAAITVQINAAPSGGKLVAPARATSLTETVALTTTDWSDSSTDLPLRYEFFAASSAAAVAIVNGSQLSAARTVQDAFAMASSLGNPLTASRVEVQLPPPDRGAWDAAGNGGGTIALFATATDVWGATASTPASALCSVSVATDLDDLIAAAAALTATALNAQSPDDALRVISNVARTLNFDEAGSVAAHANATQFAQRVALRTASLEQMAAIASTTPGTSTLLDGASVQVRMILILCFLALVVLFCADSLISLSLPLSPRDHDAQSLELVASTLAAVSEGAYDDELPANAPASIAAVATELALRSFDNAEALRPDFAVQISNAVSAVLRTTIAQVGASSAGVGGGAATDVSTLVVPVVEALAARMLRDVAAGEAPLSVSSALIQMAVRRGTSDQISAGVPLHAPATSCAQDGASAPHAPTSASSFALLAAVPGHGGALGATELIARGVQVSCLLFTVTFNMNLAHNLTRST